MSAVPRVVVLDYGSGNLRSAQRALQRAGAEVTVSADTATARRADGLIVPGVGAFAACARALIDSGAASGVTARITADRPVLGICVGMQVLFDFGTEHGVPAQGLGVLPGAVRLLRAPRLPHMGWNTLCPAAESALFANLALRDRCYFVPSYAASDDAALRNAGATLTYAEHGESFVAAVERGRLTAVQFHPEKSGDVGAKILRNWVAGL